jgi:hypothetical protein
VLVFYRDAGGYAAWCDEHPHGYVLNLRHHGSATRLHRAECGTISPRGMGRRDPTERQKACATSREALETWARERGEPYGLCPNCDV